MYHYSANNPVKYTDPDGRWHDNEDGTFTAEKGDTLWGLYGSDWKEKSGYEGNPTKLQIGDTVGKKIITDSDENVFLEMSDSNQQIKNDSGTIMNQSKQQSTLSSWLNKKTGEKLTPNEITLQKGIGIGEMVAGPTLGTLGCVQTGGGSVVYGYYVMADGAVVYSQACKGIKATPGMFFLNLLSPVSGDVNGVPTIADYNPYPLPSMKYK